MNEIIWLQIWYAQQCDGVWEHTYGIRIDTLDNPGWRLQIDGIPNNTSGSAEETYGVDESESSWIHCSLKNGKFDGACGAKNISSMIEIFRKWVDE